MKIKVNQVLEIIDKTSKAGKPYQVTTFQDPEGKLYRDVFGKLEVGQEIEGEWKQTEWGEKFEITRQQGAGGRFNDPETRNEIIRQNALTNATAYATKKAELLIQLGEIKTKSDLDKQLSGKHIVEAATYFAKYSKGDVTIVMKPEEIAKAFGYDVTDGTVREVFPETNQSDPSSNQSTDDLSNIPF